MYHSVKPALFIAVSPFLFGLALRVCLNFSDYSLFNFIGTNCHDNPIFNQNISEIIRSWKGFIAEEHYITTEDGYKILVERSYSEIRQKPLIIVHGIAMNALGWVNRGNVSLAKLLGELGYDVWMLNYRGTWYSKGHVNLTTSDKNYWSFNINHLGIYDVRSTINLVKGKTKQKPIYIGYSLGTIGFFIYSSTYPEEAKENVKAMIGLAPATNFREIKSIAKYSTVWWPLLRKITYSLWNGEMFPGYSVFLKPLVRFSGGMYIIQYFANLIFGDDFEQMDALTYPQFATQMLDTICVEVYTHGLQFFQSFAKYDFGKEKNLIEYGTPTPPIYNLSNIQVPIAFYVSQNDWLATMANAKYIYSQLNVSQRCGFHVVQHKKWNHIDFLIAKDLPKYLYKHLFNKIKEMAQGLCNS